MLPSDTVGCCLFSTSFIIWSIDSLSPLFFKVLAALSQNCISMCLVGCNLTCRKIFTQDTRFVTWKNHWLRKTKEEIIINIQGSPQIKNMLEPGQLGAIFHDSAIEQSYLLRAMLSFEVDKIRIFNRQQSRSPLLQDKTKNSTT